jgi:hypothetical protein
MGVQLTITEDEVRERTARRAAAQLVLLNKAQGGDDVAAAELLFWFSEFGQMDSPAVQEAIEDGSQEVMRRVLATTTLPTDTHGETVHALHYFGVQKRKTGRKHSAGRLLELREGFGLLLSFADLKRALTTEWASQKTKAKTSPPLPREDWPATIEEVERELMAYVRHLFKDKSIPDEAVRRYIRASFDWLPWEKCDVAATRDEPVTYPEAWV